MNLLEYIEDKIEQDIERKHDIYSLDSMTRSQIIWEKEKYYRTIWRVIKERVDE